MWVSPLMAILGALHTCPSSPLSVQFPSPGGGQTGAHTVSLGRFSSRCLWKCTRTISRSVHLVFGCELIVIFVSSALFEVNEYVTPPVTRTALTTSSSKMPPMVFL